MCKQEKSQIRQAVSGSLILDLEVAFFSKLFIVDQDGLIRIISWIFHFRIIPYKQQILLSADYLYKQFGPRSGPTFCRSWSWSKQFVTLIVFLKEYFEKVNFEKSQQTTTRALKLPNMLRIQVLSVLKWEKFNLNKIPVLIYFFGPKSPWINFLI